MPMITSPRLNVPAVFSLRDKPTRRRNEKRWPIHPRVGQNKLSRGRVMRVCLPVIVIRVGLGLYPTSIKRDDVRRARPLSPMSLIPDPRSPV